MVPNVVLSMLSTGWLQEEQIQAWFNSQAQLIALIKLVKTIHQQVVKLTLTPITSMFTVMLYNPSKSTPDEIYLYMYINCVT